MELTPERVAFINSLLDFIMGNIQQNVQTLKNYQRVPIHDLVKKLEANLSLTSLTASLKASKGTLSDLTTIRRVGDVALSSEGNTIFISLTITLDYLVLRFDKYTLQLSLLKISGDKLKLNVKDNLFDLLLVIHFNGLEVDVCFEKFKLKKFSDIDVDITGFGALNPVVCKIANWIVDHFNDFLVKDVAEPYAKNLFNSAVSDKDFLRRLFGYAISGMVKGASSNIHSTRSSSSDRSSTTSEDLPAPVAPVRQRRNPTRLPGAQRNNLNNPSGSRTSSVSQRNNNKVQSTVPQQSNGSVNSLSPDVNLRNNLSHGKNEIYIEPRKVFSSRPPKLVEADHILAVKPPML